MPSLAEALQDYLAAKGVSALKAARSVKLSDGPFMKVLKHGARPNAGTIGRYAKLLGKSEAEIRRMIAAAPAPKPADTAPPLSGSTSDLIAYLQKADATMKDPLVIKVMSLKPDLRNALAVLLMRL